MSALYVSRHQIPEARMLDAILEAQTRRSSGDRSNHSLRHEATQIGSEALPLTAAQSPGKDHDF